MDFQKKMAEFRQKKLCYGCGKSGHIRDNCPDPHLDNCHGAKAVVMRADWILTSGADPDNMSDASLWIRGVF
jgi:hypothetical protein